MKGLRSIVGAWLLLSSQATLAGVPEFFDTLFREYGEACLEVAGVDFADFCQRHELADSSRANREAHGRILFFHALLTGSSASDCSRGGILGIPYFWHWVESNPRHSIVFVANEVPLVEKLPEGPYRSYATFADIDRVPLLFLEDLVRSEPRYRHPDCGDFFTFGWCSEREMAFVAIQHALGYEAKVVQEGIHTWSEIRYGFQGRDGGRVVLIASVDNTFGTVRWTPGDPSASLGDWLEETGHGETIGWYNRKARSPEQIRSLQSVRVSPEAASRIRERVSAWLGDQRGRSD